MSRPTMLPMTSTHNTQQYNQNRSQLDKMAPNRLEKFIIDLDPDSDCDLESNSSGAGMPQDEMSEPIFELGRVEQRPLTKVKSLVEAIIAVDSANPSKDNRSVESIRYSYATDGLHLPPVFPLSAAVRHTAVLPFDFEINDQLWMSYQENSLLYYIQNGVANLADVQAIVPELNRKSRVIQAMAINIGYHYAAGGIPNTTLDAMLIHIFAHGDQRYRIYEVVQASLDQHKQRMIKHMAQHKAYQQAEQLCLQQLRLQQQRFHTAHPPSAIPYRQYPNLGYRAAQNAPCTLVHHPRPILQTPTSPPTPPDEPTTTSTTQSLKTTSKPPTTYLFKPPKSTHRTHTLPIKLPPAPSPNEEAYLRTRALTTDAKRGTKRGSKGPLAFSAKTKHLSGFLFSKKEGEGVVVRIPGWTGGVGRG
ncbi:hypothetical protein T440DRAFT_517297 [Plenodomus tracheiphilus IPT5]|uniref:Uncharacterized protein n=1 Tax=Plenodomus tracheiphilus IPT5 TaxID=1408161 RepID=A0A6A7BBP6_9PLEO|nr:hypothetical protein T440DRAFT_517297 [Plenodomus tracheiphilus IPT5]